MKSKERRQKAERMTGVGAEVQLDCVTSTHQNLLLKIFVNKSTNEIHRFTIL